MSSPDTTVTVFFHLLSFKMSNYKWSSSSSSYSSVSSLPPAPVGPVVKRENVIDVTSSPVLSAIPGSSDGKSDLVSIPISISEAAMAAATAGTTTNKRKRRSPGRPYGLVYSFSQPLVKLDLVELWAYLLTVPTRKDAKLSKNDSVMYTDKDHSPPFRVVIGKSSIKINAHAIEYLSLIHVKCYPEILSLIAACGRDGPMNPRISTTKKVPLNLIEFERPDDNCSSIDGKYRKQPWKLICLRFQYLAAGCGQNTIKWPNPHKGYQTLPSLLEFTFLASQVDVMEVHESGRFTISTNTRGGFADPVAEKMHASALLTSVISSDHDISPQSSIFKFEVRGITMPQLLRYYKRAGHEGVIERGQLAIKRELFGSPVFMVMSICGSVVVHVKNLKDEQKVSWNQTVTDLISAEVTAVSSDDAINPEVVYQDIITHLHKRLKGPSHRDAEDEKKHEMSIRENERRKIMSCVQCKNGQIEKILTPCGHISLCSTCIDDKHRLTPAGRKCPTCGAMFAGYISFSLGH